MSWSFTLVCLDQIVNNAANVRYMSGGQYKVPIVFPRRQRHRAPARRNPQPPCRVHLHAHPGSDRRSLPARRTMRRDCSRPAIRCDDPVIFLESEKMLNDHRRSARRGISAADRQGLVIEREGRDVTVISYGRPLQRVVRSAVSALVDNEDVDVELIDVRTLRPLDTETIIQLHQKDAIAV